MKTFVFILVMFDVGLFQNYDGDTDESCQLEDGSFGVCRNVNNCSYALNLLIQKSIPKICGFEGHNVFVCCAESSTRTVLKPIRKPGEISKEMCRSNYYIYDFLHVFNGNLSSIREIPHMAVIGYDSEEGINWACGGALISKSFILTAAHCLYSRSTGPAKYVRLGDSDLASTTDDEDPQQILVKRSIPFPDYNPPLKYHDIGLIELESPVWISQYANLACLNTIQHREATYMTAAGWGKTEYAGQASTVLMKANLLVFPQDSCQRFYRSSDLDSLPNGIVDDTMICAGGESDTCQGDSGGPLFVPNTVVSKVKPVYDIVGVTSFGKACGVAKIPGVYTRVYNYLQWIEDIVWPDTQTN